MNSTRDHEEERRKWVPPATMQWGHLPLAGDEAMRWGHLPLAGESPTIEYPWEGQLRSAINHDPTSDWMNE